MNLVTVLLIFISVTSQCYHYVESAKILGIFHVPAFSHQQLGNRLLQELAAKGHNVTVLTPIVPKEPIKNINAIKIDLEPLYKLHEDKKQNLFDNADLNTAHKILRLDFMGVMFTEAILEDDNVQKLLKSNEKFDVIIMENFLNEAFRGFCYHFDAPCVLLSTIGATRWTNPQMGNPGPPSYVPDMYVNYSSDMNFWQRLYNSIVYAGAELFQHLYTLRKHNEILHRFFPGAPHIYDLYYNTTLMLLNSDVSTNAPVPLVPNMINIGGFHVEPAKKLPEDLQEFLDNATEGVIFFSMGSNLKSKDIAKEKCDAILRVFSRLKQKILWKFEDESLPNQPDNLKISNWLPQQDVLAHPNIKLFITHGGLLSITEAIYYGIPIIGIPIFGDQEINVANAEIAGFGIGLTYGNLNEETFENVINEALNNHTYSENAKRRSKIMHDQPMKPLDRATFWVEYVIRHQGAPHLKTAALNLYWYQYLLLDVVAVVAFAAIAIIFITYKVVKVVFSKIHHKRNHDVKKKIN